MRSAHLTQFVRFTSLLKLLAFIVVPAWPAAWTADPMGETLQRGLLAEEAHHNLDAAITAYQAVVAQYDDQRRLVATALFRLGETYRKQGKTVDAIAQYQRLIAEFNDQPELARLSRLQLESLAPGTTISSPLPPAVQRQRELLAEELELVERQIKEMQARIDRGRAGPVDLIPLQREALVLKRQMAALDASPPMHSAVRPDDPAGERAAVHSVSEEEQREIEQLREMIRTSPDLLNALSGAGYAPLHAAAQQGRLAVAELLIASGADIDVRDRQQSTPLHLAIESGNKTMTERLITSGARVDATNERGQTPLHTAAARGFVELARVLLAAGSGIHAAKTTDGTPLHYAVETDQLAMIDFLLDSGAELEARTVDGNTPLHFAVRRNHLLSAERLLERGANVNATNAVGDSVLHLTVRFMQSDQLLRTFLERKPDLELRGSQNLTPLQVAVIQRPSIQRPSAVRLLLQAGADPNVSFDAAGIHPVQLNPHRSRVPDGQTPLHWAVAEWNTELSRLLIAHDADPTATDESGTTPLHRAAFGSEPIAELLIEHGADVNTQDELGNTPLHVACYAGKETIVQLLLKHGAQADKRNHLEHTPLDFTTEIASWYVVMGYANTRGGRLVRVTNPDGNPGRVQHSIPAAAANIRKLLLHSIGSDRKF